MPGIPIDFLPNEIKEVILPLLMKNKDNVAYAINPQLQ
jgi:hypothetical protein